MKYSASLYHWIGYWLLKKLIQEMPMVDLPSGTVTFLFSDIEGSTRLLQQLGKGYAILLDEHQRLIREACKMQNGSIVDTQGDSFFVSFPRALDAIQAAVQLQHAFAAYAESKGVNLRVRMGIHTGEPQINLTRYVGIDVHRAARIAAAAHGSQVLLSQTTYHLIESELPEGVALRDLGEHRLKDLHHPEHLYQLVFIDIPSDFPALISLELSPNNLPVQLTSFIGRAKEVTEVKQLLSSGRLLTLTGPGGSGKTRLALQAAAEMIESFEDGIFFVALAPIIDPVLVPSTIAQSLSIQERSGGAIIESLMDHLKNRSLLLLLDNFEQVIQAAPIVAELLVACIHLKILVTSREGLRISGEREYPVPPLALPDLAHLPALESLPEFAAIELFLQRAQAVKPGFILTPETAPAIAEICCRLDGLPLAIELAAARIKLMPPRAMLSRLERRLEFLTGGGRDLPARQRTLRNTIEWSYDLLSEYEKRLFRRLSVFVDGCTIEAAEAVTADTPTQISIYDQFGSLLDKSLLREVDGTNGEPRYLMLEMLREYGLEQLEVNGEAEIIRQRHASYFLALAEQVEAMLERVDQAEWMNRMELELDNLRAALEWSKTAKDGGEICLRLAGALGLFWEAHGYNSEGRERLSEILLTEAAQGRTAARALLLTRAAELAYRQSDYPMTTTLAGESLAIYRELDNKQGIATTLNQLGNAATEGGDFITTSTYLEEALAIWRELGDKYGMTGVLISLGWAALRPGDYHQANEWLGEALKISRELGDTRRIAFELSGLGEVALRQGDYERAERLVEESLELRRQLGNKWGVGVCLGTLGWVAMCQGDWIGALARLGESLEVRREIGDKGGSAWCLERLAEVAIAQGEAEKAVRLFGAAAALRRSIGSVIDPVDQTEYESMRTALRNVLGEEQFTDLWKEGLEMNLEQATAYALGM